MANKKEHSVPFTPVACSLADLAGEAQVAAACHARAFLSGRDAAALRKLAAAPVDFFPAPFQRRLKRLLPQVGQVVAPPVSATPGGMGTAAFQRATKTNLAPVSGLGYYRVGEDGRLYAVSKSEHYHAPLGHGFPGYALIDRARALGVPNATHNNTRGAITRRLEEELIRAANGLPPEADLAGVRASADPAVLNRVLNLETGSLAVEAACKLALARFYRHEAADAPPKYHGRIPVFLVVGDDDGAVAGNYHGTTVSTQLLRGLWPELRATLEQAGALRVCAVRPNSTADLDAAFREFEKPPYKIAAFFHEIIMMNYGARVLTREFLQHAHRLCAAHDAPAVVDEIQSCMWYDGLFLFRQYGLRPAMVVIGKGFPGGEYPASRILFSAPFDTLPQFGALVTNGQEELAALAYLVTMRWTAANGAAITARGQRLERGLRRLAADFPGAIAGVEGLGHLLGLRFRDLASGKIFAGRMNEAGFDISVQTYKANCPPVALTKLPTIAGDELIDLTLKQMRAALEGL
jgi:4-aminobutyrate aminotransferase-like enzyme